MRSNLSSQFDGDRLYGVTVFGFPPEKASAIINRFQKHGEIVKRIPGNNWVDIYYKQPMHVNLALTLNGKMIDGLMIGVIPTADNAEFGRREDDTLSRSRVFESPSVSGMRTRTPRTARKRLEGRDIEITAARKGGLCGRFMQYLFNW